MVERSLWLRRCMAAVAVASASLAVWTGCVGDDPAAPSGEGSLGQACYANGTCLEGLECRAGTCHDPGGSTDAAPGLGVDAHDPARPDGASACTAYRDTIMADTPLAYWRMNTTSGVTIVDETPQHNDLTLAGGGFALGAKGALACDTDPAIHFDGKQAYAFASNAFSRAVDFGAKEPFTIELWVQREESDADVSYFHVFGNKIGTTTKTGYLFYFNDLLHGMSLEYDWPGGSKTLAAPSQAGAWTHYVTTFDGTKIGLYANGALADSDMPVQAMGARDQPFVLARETGVDGHNFLGAIDEVVIYSWALSPEDVARHYDVATRN